MRYNYLNPQFSYFVHLSCMTISICLKKNFSPIYLLTMGKHLHFSVGFKCFSSIVSSLRFLIHLSPQARGEHVGIASLLLSAG